MTTPLLGPASGTTTPHGAPSGPTHAGGPRVLAHGRDSGLPDVDALAAETLAAYAASDACCPDGFPELPRAEASLVGFGLDLVDAPGDAGGTVTVSGSESALMAVLAARRARPDVRRPSIVLPDTAHPAFLSAADLLGVRAVVVPTDAARRAQVGPMAHAMDEDTVLAVVSAPTAAHGVVDPVAWIGTAAAAKGVPLHVDAGEDGWLLAFGERLGRIVPPWTFAVAGVTSISMELHAHAHAPRGAALLLHRDASGRQPGATGATGAADLAGRPLVSPTIGLSRPGAPIAAAARVVSGIGHDGYLRLAAQTFGAVEAMVAGVRALPGLSLACEPDASLVLLRADGDADVFTVAAELRSRGWYADCQPSWGDLPALLRLGVGAGTRAHVEELLDALRESAAAAEVTGPARLPGRVTDHLLRLSPEHLTGQDVRTLLETLGIDPLGDPVPLLDALVDAAPTRLRPAIVGRLADLRSAPTRG